MNYLGIDEAGLGPILGPFCVGLTSFESRDDIELKSVLGELINESPRSSRRIVVDDSKKIFSKTKGIEVLERTVLSFVHLYTGKIPKTFGEYLQVVMPEYKGYLDIPWFKNIENLELPLKASCEVCAENGKYLNEQSKITGVKLKYLGVSMAVARDFNLLLDQTGNKALACKDIIDKLLNTIKPINQRVIVDQQGGRRFYSDWLGDVYSDSIIKIINEGSGGGSCYKVDDMSVEFHCKADQNYFEVALASLFAKYTREVFMHMFNLYWQGFTDIKATAGYPQDGKRFLNDLDKAGLLPKNIDLLRRKK